jgi:hypothetical protein
MKPHALFLTTALAAFALGATAAETSEAVKSAIKKLSDQPNYSWTSATKTEGSRAGRNQGPIDGKTDKEGVIYISSTAGDSSYEAALKGEKVAVLFGGQWVTPDDLGEGGERAVARLRAIKTPAAEAEDLLGKTKELKKDEEGVFAGDMTAEAAKELFGKLGRRAAEAMEAKGSVKFWLKEGALAKYEFTVQGKIKVGEEQREVDVSRTTTVEVKEVGSTKLTLPEEVKKKLS